MVTIISTFDAGDSFTVGNNGVAIIGIGSGDTGSLTATNIYVSDGGILSGVGTIYGDTSIEEGGTLAAGNSPGNLTFNDDLVFQEDSIWEIEIGGLDAGEYDTINVLGNLKLLGGTIVFNFLDDFLPQADDGPLSFLMAEDITGLEKVVFEYVGLAEGFLFEVALQDDGTVGFNAENDGVSVPEPRTLVLFSLGLIGLGLSRRKKA